MSFLLILIFFMHEHYKKVNVQNVCFNVPKKQSNSHPVVLRVIFHSLGGPECVEVYSRQKKATRQLTRETHRLWLSKQATVNSYIFHNIRALGTNKVGGLTGLTGKHTIQLYIYTFFRNFVLFIKNNTIYTLKEKINARVCVAEKEEVK